MPDDAPTSGAAWPPAALEGMRTVDRLLERFSPQLSLTRTRAPFAAHGPSSTRSCKARVLASCTVALARRFYAWPCPTLCTFIGTPRPALACPREEAAPAAPAASLSSRHARCSKQYSPTYSTRASGLPLFPCALHLSAACDTISLVGVNMPQVQRAQGAINSPAAPALAIARAQARRGAELINRT